MGPADESSHIKNNGRKAVKASWLMYGMCELPRFIHAWHVVEYTLLVVKNNETTKIKLNILMLYTCSYQGNLVHYEGINIDENTMS